MLDWLEGFLNRLNDWDMGWGAALKLRPTKDVRMGAAQIIGYFLPGILIIAPAVLLLSAFGMVYFPAVYRISLPAGTRPSPALIVSAALHLATIPFIQAALTIGVILAAVCIAGTIWAWNRRADRLRAEEQPAQDDAHPGDWPPTPRMT
jgi:hypothetical protein